MTTKLQNSKVNLKKLTQEYPEIANKLRAQKYLDKFIHGIKLQRNYYNNYAF